MVKARPPSWSDMVINVCRGNIFKLCYKWGRIKGLERKKVWYISFTLVKC